MTAPALWALPAPWPLATPLPTRSPLFYLQLTLQPGARFGLPAGYEEQALYIVHGELDLGADGVHAAGRLLVTRASARVSMKAGAQGATVMLLGGEPMDGPRHIVWNFVSSDRDRIEQAKRELLLEKQPSGEFVTPEQLGALAVFLCSDAARFITGVVLPVDGGYLIS